MSTPQPSKKLRFWGIQLLTGKGLPRQVTTRVDHCHRQHRALETSTGLVGGCVRVLWTPFHPPFLLVGRSAHGTLDDILPLCDRLGGPETRTNRDIDGPVFPRVSLLLLKKGISTSENRDRGHGPRGPFPPVEEPQIPVRNQPPGSAPLKQDA